VTDSLTMNTTTVVVGVVLDDVAIGEAQLDASDTDVGRLPGVRWSIAFCDEGDPLSGQRAT
jgi:hypothetical protein